jgi:hypothetical protein
VSAREDIWSKTDQEEMIVEIKTRKSKWIKHTVQEGKLDVYRKGIKSSKEQKWKRRRITWMRKIKEKASKEGKVLNETER